MSEWNRQQAVAAALLILQPPGVRYFDVHCINTHYLGTISL